MASQKWRIGIMCSRSQINLDILLNCGQSFRWKRKNEEEWIGVIRNHVWRLRQTGNGILYIVHGDQPLLRNQFLAGEEERKMLKEECKPSVANNKSEDNYDGVTFKLEGEKALNLDVKDFKVEPETVGKRGQRIKKERKRPAIKTEETDCVIPNKHLKSVESTDHTSNTKTASCHLPSALLKNGKMNIESLKKLYLIDDLNYGDDDEYLHPSENCESVLQDYFQADINLCNLYDHWSSRDSHFKDVAAEFEGIRMLRQDPTENLLSFVCSSNNHISRISSMVEKLCVHYGTFITEVDGDKYFSFPTMSALTGDNVEDHLRQLGFGYRAKFISAIAKFITNEKSDGWLESLRDSCTYSEAKSELIKLMGVGAKVADCVCLMSLDKPQAVPVDTHVWQITMKNYMAKLQTAKSLTERIYNEIGDFYRDLWGPYAGWAHSVLFTADLKHNKTKKVSSANALTGKIKAQATGKGGKVKSDEGKAEKETKRKQKGRKGQIK